MSLDIFDYGGLEVFGGQISSAITFADDVLLKLGSDSDIAMLLRSATLNADTVLAGVIVGTPDTSALAANSLIISNKTTDGDILIAVSDGGHSKQMIFMDGSTGITHIGLPGTPSISATGDVYMGGQVEIEKVLFVNRDIHINDSKFFHMGNAQDSAIGYQSLDSDARHVIFWIDESIDSGDNVPVWAFMEHTGVIADLGLFDEVVQPHIVTITNSGQLHAATDGVADAGAASAVLKKVGGFTNGAVGDIVRMTGGTNVTVGWYWITTRTSADQVTLDRNYTSGDTTNVVFQTWSKVAMITPKAIYLPIYDGAPQDSDIDIPMAGAMALDVGQGNGRLYWRVGDGWHYTNATAGFEIPAGETDCPKCGKPIEVDDSVIGVTNARLSDGALHGVWCHAKCGVKRSFISF